jgi:hypothetical protein
MEDVALRAFSIGIALSLCFYVYLVSATALNVIAGKEANAKAASIEGDVGLLQQRYFSLSHRVANTRADAIGLVPVVGTAYVYRPSSVGMAYTADNAN